MEDTMEARCEFILEFDPDDFVDYVALEHPDVVGACAAESDVLMSSDIFGDVLLKYAARQFPDVIDEYVRSNKDDYRYWLEQK